MIRFLSMPLLALQSSPEVIDRIPEAYSNFVIPFVVGIVFAITWLLVGLIRALVHLGSEDRKTLFRSMIDPATAWKNIKDIFCDCLLHTKIWKRNKLLGYMHSAIAFGWFLLIILGHLEVAFFVPKHLNPKYGALFYPIFYRFFVWVDPEHLTLKGSFFFFMMDLCLLYVLSGIFLAIVKRVRRRIFGMKRVTRHTLPDMLALYALWGIFPLRLLAESFTANLAGGSFLTYPANAFLRWAFGENLHIMPWWWAYSICLGVFFLAMPFSRYMHILSEPLLILFRNAGLKRRKVLWGYTEAEVYSCPGCGLCIDACPMTVQKKNVKFASVYLLRRIRRHNDRMTTRIADKCLECGKCAAVCPIGIGSPEIRLIHRTDKYNTLPYSYDYLSTALERENESIGNRLFAVDEKPKVAYFAGCMTHLTPAVKKAVEEVFRAAGENFIFLDRDGGICCGRPLMLSGRKDAAKKTIEANTLMIKSSGCSTLVLSCPICTKIFREEYDLKGIEVLHYTQYMERLVSEGRLTLSKGSEKYVFHDPCELGRGLGIYEEPRAVLEKTGCLVEAAKNRKESICCGGSLGSLTLDSADRQRITEASIANLTANDPDAIVTACPLCLKTFSDRSRIPVKDIAEVVASKIAAEKSEAV